MSGLGTKFVKRPWQKPLAAAAVPFLLVIATTLPPHDRDKRLWPWTTLRPALQKFHGDILAAGTALELPVNRPLTQGEIELLATRTPIKIDLAFPLIPLPVSARFDGFGRHVWLYWGDATFGPIDPQTMQIHHASD